MYQYSLLRTNVDKLSSVLAFDVREDLWILWRQRMRSRWEIKR